MTGVLNDYRLAGVKLIWVVNPQVRMILVYESDGAVTRLFESDTLCGGEVLPGFSVKVGDLFPAK